MSLSHAFISLYPPSHGVCWGRFPIMKEMKEKCDVEFLHLAAYSCLTLKAAFQLCSASPGCEIQVLA